MLQRSTGTHTAAPANAVTIFWASPNWATAAPVVGTIPGVNDTQISGPVKAWLLVLTPSAGQALDVAQGAAEATVVTNTFVAGVLLGQRLTTFAGCPKRTWFLCIHACVSNSILPAQ